MWGWGQVAVSVRWGVRTGLRVGVELERGQEEVTVTALGSGEEGSRRSQGLWQGDLVCPSPRDRADLLPGPGRPSRNAQHLKT